jgi:hypothetical protein
LPDEILTIGSAAKRFPNRKKWMAGVNLSLSCGVFAIVGLTTIFLVSVYGELVNGRLCCGDNFVETRITAQRIPARIEAEVLPSGPWR